MIAVESARLPEPFGSALDRSQPIDFAFDGTTYRGFAGDTVAGALWAAGRRVLARSFKYKRPRGIFSLTGFDGGLLVQAGDEPNVPADRLALRPGLPPLHAQNFAGSLERDLEAGTGLLGRFLPVGFYYRAFFRPRGAWEFFEPLIRKRGGLGVLRPSHAHAPQTDKQYLFCDVAVVGAGPAGLASARDAARAGDDVLLVECEPELGGSSRYRPSISDAALRAEVVASSNVRVLTNGVAQGLYADNWLAVEAEHRLYKVRAGRVVVATGSFEQPLVFRNNDLPGVMLASAASRLIHLYGVRPGRRAVVATVNDDGLRTAIDLLDAGVEVVAVADLRGNAAASDVHRTLAARGVAVMPGTTVYEALAARSAFGFYFGGSLAGVRLARVDGATIEPAGEPIPCDVLCVAGGYTPNAALLCHAGMRMGYDPAQQTLAIGALPPSVEAVGSVCGITDASGPAAFVVPHPQGKEFIDLDEDLTVHDIANAIADGFTHVELLKRYSTGGMGPSQGKYSTLATLRVAAAAREVEPAALGTTTVRAPFTGMRARLLAGKAFSPYRCSSIHDRHVELGAQIMLAGVWYRPAFYGPAINADELIRREVHAVRNGVGMIDVSTLGGIELSGPDAAAFLDRVYTTPHGKQPVGRSRYVLLCDDGGAIVDDGVACRLAPNRFYVTATTTAADQTYRTMVWLNAQWRMAVDITNVTSAFAAINIAGPRARAVLSRIATEVDLSPDAFKYLEVRTGTIAGIAARLIRVGFVGELGYEIHVATSDGVKLWDALIEAGRDEGIVPFGVEAQRVLRLEKGHVIVGQDTDGLTHPYEAAMSWAIGKGKTDFIGCKAIEAQRDTLTRMLVGFRLEDPSLPPPPECCLVIRDGAIAGRVTSAVRSEACGGVIGLAFVAPDEAAPGSTFTIRLPTRREITARVVPLPFYDPDNARQQL